MSNLLVIGLGGMGAEIVKILDSEPVPSNLDYRIYDSTDSNVRTGFNPEKLKLVPNVTGSGAHRGINLTPYKAFVESIVPTIPKHTIVVLTYGVSGGTGSSLGPLLNKALLEQGYSVINIVTINQLTKQATDNALKTLKSLASGSKTKPTHVIIEEENHQVTYSKLNELIISHIGDLLRVVSDLPRLDQTDIKNWLDHTIHGIKPGLTLIERYNDLDRLAQATGVISLLSVVKDPDTKIPDVKAMVNYMGESNDGGDDTHFITTMTGMSKLRSILDNRLSEFVEVRNDLDNVDDAFSGDEEADDDGFVV